MNFIKKIFLIAIILLNSSCYLVYDPMPKSWDWGAKPRPMRGIRNFPSTDTEYGKGFRDGCKASWDALATGLLGDLSARYDFRRMKKSDDYDSGWWDGIEQCTYITDWDVF
jgi:hypothetical protein